MSRNKIKQEDIDYYSLTPEKQIAEAIIKLRKQRNMTQKQLSYYTGISQSDISKLETAKANPSISILKRIAKVFSCDLIIQFKK